MEASKGIAPAGLPEFLQIARPARAMTRCMKRVLCVSPHFPPVNAPDMQRLRQLLPYFREFGWQPVVFAVDPELVEGAKDELLLKTLLPNTEIHNVNAIPARVTRLIGVGNLGFRSWFHLRSAVDDYLRRHRVDLIYFTTTVFASIALGPHWQYKFGIPFVVDLQDPWRNDYYLSLPPARRPPKFWFDYRQKKFLEARILPKANGIMAVSEAYIQTLNARYPQMRHTPTVVLPFAGLAEDFEIAAGLQPVIGRLSDRVNAVYVGRGGPDMAFSLALLFGALAKGLKTNPSLFSRLRCSAYGTSYAAGDGGVPTVIPVAKRFGVADRVIEVPKRLPYFQALRALLDADLLVVPGSDDPTYTASKIFTYILTQKPLLAIFARTSSVVGIIEKTGAGRVVAFGKDDSVEALTGRTAVELEQLLRNIPFKPATDWAAFEPYTAREMTRKTCAFFDRVVA
jgi:hypothetical protein